MEYLMHLKLVQFRRVSSWCDKGIPPVSFLFILLLVYQTYHVALGHNMKTKYHMRIFSHIGIKMASNLRTWK